MILNEDAVRRMIDISGSTATGSGSALGGGGGGIPAGNFVSTEYYNQNFTLVYKQETTDGTTGDVTTAFLTAAPNVIPTVGTETDTETGDVIVTSLIGQKVLNALVIGDILMEWDETNNAIKVVKQDGTAANFYATGGVSALGANSGGGGGGDTLNALLANINNSSIGDIAPTSSEVGKCLVYNGDNTWTWAIPGGGGGGGTGTVTSITAGRGLTGGTINVSGTIAVDESLRMRFFSSTNYVAARFYGNDGNVDNTRAGLACDNGYIEWWQNSKWMNHAMGCVILADSSAQIRTYGTNGNTFNLPSTSGTLALTSQIPSLTGYATQQWVQQQNYLTAETYLGTVTSVAMTVPTGFSVSGSPITSSGTLALSFASGYSLPTTAKQSNWDTAYNQRHTHSNKSVLDGITATNVSNWNSAYNNQGNYLLKEQGMSFTVQGDSYIAARFWTASGASDTTRAAKAQGNGYIEWWSSGGYFNHEMGFIRAKGNVEVGTGTSDTAHYLQIGGGRLFWDNTNNALYVQKADGTACHLYATGGVSALGMNVGGTPSMNALTLQNLTVNGSATINTLAVTNAIESLDVEELNVINELMLNGNNIYMDGGNIEDAYQVQTAQMIVGSGGSTIKKIYWDGTYLQVQIGTTTYKFVPDATA